MPLLNDKDTKMAKKYLPDGKKFEMTSDKTFRLETKGGGHFEGTIDPRVAKARGGRVSMSVDVCMKIGCINRDKKCVECFRNSHYIKE